MTIANFDDKVAAIAFLTDANNHNEAYIKGCELIGATALKEKFILVRNLCELEGCLPYGLSEYRYGLYKEMKAIAKNVLTEDEYAEFYGAF